MVSKFKKTCLIVSSLLACSGLAYSEDSPQVVSQGGLLELLVLVIKTLDSQIQMLVEPLQQHRLPVQI